MRRIILGIVMASSITFGVALTGAILWDMGLAPELIPALSTALLVGWLLPALGVAVLIQHWRKS